MATYLILNVVFLFVVLLLLRPRRIPHLRAWFATLAVLLLLTAVFDNLIIHFDIVAYDVSKLLGVYVGSAPIEDFFYSLLAVFLIPIIWHRLKKSPKKENDHAK